MTREEFIAIVQLHPERVNIWYEPSTSTIYAISVPVLDNSDQDITNYLEQVQQIGVPFLPNGSVLLTITARQLITSTVNNIQVKCFYFDVTPISTSTLTSTTETGSIQLYPAIDSAQFYDSPYNVLHGSIEEVRTSAYIMQSDRYKIGTLANPTYTGPLNIDQLLSGSASLAHVQDSNYSSTGWINGRYDGSKTDRVTYRTDPAIGGSIFKGAETPKGTTDTQILYNNDNGQIIYKDMFYAGTGDTPGFYPIYSGYIYTGSAALNDTSTTMAITTAPEGNIPSKIPTSGDLIRLGTEIIKINSVAVLTIPWLKYTLGVQRGYNSPPEFHSNEATVEYVSQVQIYNILGNRLTGVPKGDVLVQQSGQLLNLDPLGYIVEARQVLTF
jgi:hypothetical protein